MKKIKIFEYIKEIDAFTVTLEYKEIADYLGLAEWNYVVWIGRLFCLDNDYGEHWFDNWEQREAMKERAMKIGYDSDELLFIDAKRFANEVDGPCNSDEIRKVFWTNVLQSLELDIELLFEIARKFNKRDIDLSKEYPDDTDYQDYIKDLEYRVLKLIERYQQ